MITIGNDSDDGPLENRREDVEEILGAEFEEPEGEELFGDSIAK